MSRTVLTSFHFGHEIYLEIKPGRKNNDWRYMDNDKLLDEDQADRRCPKCDKLPTEDGHDPCIANLPGVAYACCGHGVEEGYVKFPNGIVVRGDVIQSHPIEGKIP